MAFHGQVTIPANTMTLLNATSVTGLTVANASAWGVVLVPTVAAVAPVTTVGGVPLAAGGVLLSTLGLGDIWPGIAAEYVWGYSTKEMQVQVSHA